MKQTYRGSCHCGAVRFEADTDLEQVTFRCNCSFCAKSRAWFAFVPASDVRLLAGEGDLVDYQFGKKRLHHFFCRTCGVRPFTRATDAKGIPTFALRVNCLDGVEPQVLAKLPVRYFDMLHDRPEPPPPETRYL